MKTYKIVYRCKMCGDKVEHGIFWGGENSCKIAMLEKYRDFIVVHNCQKPEDNGICELIGYEEVVE